MRARELPNKLFQEFVEATQNEVKGFTQYGHVIQAIFLEEQQAVVGVCEIDNFAYFRLWKFRFDSEFEPQKVGDPVMQIIGGPLSAGTSAYSHGRELVESVRIKFSYGICAKGLNPDDPLSGLMALLIMKTIEICQSEGLANLQYWQVLLNPEREHTKP